MIIIIKILIINLFHLSIYLSLPIHLPLLLSSSFYPSSSSSFFLLPQTLSYSILQQFLPHPSIPFPSPSPLPVHSSIKSSVSPEPSIPSLRSSIRHTLTALLHNGLPHNPSFTSFNSFLHSFTSFFLHSLFHSFLIFSSLIPSFIPSFSSFLHFFILSFSPPCLPSFLPSFLFFLPSSPSFTSSFLPLLTSLLFFFHCVLFSLFPSFPPSSIYSLPPPLK